MRLFKINKQQAYIWSPFLWFSNSLLIVILLARLVLKIFEVTALNYFAFLVYLTTDMLVSPFMDLAGFISRQSPEYPLEIMAAAFAALTALAPILALKYIGSKPLRERKIAPSKATARTPQGHLRAATT